MIVLADNDILLKLARCDLFDEFLTAFGVTPVDVRILRTARFSVTSNKHRKRIGEDSFARLSSFLDRVIDIDTAPDPAAIAALTEQTNKNIDAGEAALFAVCPLVPESVIVTGDKNAAKQTVLCSTSTWANPTFRSRSSGYTSGRGGTPRRRSTTATGRDWTAAP